MRLDIVVEYKHNVHSNNAVGITSVIDIRDRCERVKAERDGRRKAASAHTVAMKTVTDFVYSDCCYTERTAQIEARINSLVHHAFQCAYRKQHNYSRDVFSRNTNPP